MWGSFSLFRMVCSLSPHLELGFGVLDFGLEKSHEKFKDSLRDGNIENAIFLKSLECLEEAKSRWRTIEAIQSGLDFTTLKSIDDLESLIESGGHRGVNFVNGAALPLVLRICLVQPIISGTRDEQFVFGERMGHQAMWEHKTTGHWSTRRRHDAVMRLFGAAMNKIMDYQKRCVFEKDADFSRSCFVSGGKRHRPDMIIDNAFDDNIKIVFDLTNVAPFTRVGSQIAVVENHLAAAEEKKRSSPAWANFVPSDGLVSEFVPIALGWFGDLGNDALDFVRRIVEHHFGEGYVAQWKIRKTLAQIQVKHLNCLGTYLCSVRHDMEVHGPLLRKGKEKWEHACLREHARGIEASSRARHGGRMCISQVEQLCYMSVSTKQRLANCSETSFSSSQGEVRLQKSISIDGEICGAVLVDE